MNSHLGIETLKLLGGERCIDFVNTIDWRTGRKPVEFLTSYKDFANWTHHAGLTTESQMEALIRAARKLPKAAARVHRRVLELRECLYRIFLAAAHGETEDERSLHRLNQWMQWMYKRSVLAELGQDFRWKSCASMDWPLLPLVQNASKLLTSDSIHFLGECSGEGCGWFFVDRSRNRLRRWCSMRSCGNQAKARKFYNKKRKQTRSPKD
jgi:predicted RNA-binding Zn ribbon-like protein